MSVGDLKNNLRKLQSQLRAIKYEKDIDLDSISKGVASSFLPIYHYVFLEYSRAIAEMITDKNFEMSGKADLRFVETMYRVLRDVFSFKPPITKEQFFSNGFVERKIIMCVDVVQLIRNKNRVLTLKTTKTRQRINQSVKLGPRTVAPSVPKESTVNTTMDSLIDAASKLPPMAPHKPTVNSALPIHVVNEVHHSIESCLPADIPAPSVVKEPFPIQAECKPSTEPVYVCENSPLITRTTEPVTMETRVIREEGALAKRSQQVAWADMKAVIVNISDRRTSEAEHYNPARYGSVVEYSQSLIRDPHPTSVTSKTTAPSNCLTYFQLSSEDDDPHLKDEIKETSKTKERSDSDLVQRALQDRLDRIEKLLALQQEQTKQREPVKSNEVTPEQIETLMARVTLLENKVSLLDSQLKATKNNPKKELSQRNGYLEGDRVSLPAALPLPQAPSLPFSPISSTEMSCRLLVNSDKLDHSYGELCFNNIDSIKEIDRSKLPSEVEKNSDIEERWSSTPTELGEHLNAAGCSSIAADKNIGEQKERILNMLKSTEALLNVQVVTPLREDAKQSSSYVAGLK